MVERITISLPESLSTFVKETAAIRKISRSHLIGEMIGEERRKLLEQELAEGYIALAEEHRLFAEAAVEIVDEAWGFSQRPSPS